MILVKIFRKNNLFLGFEASGHSNKGVKGNDIVCSAVSALLETWSYGSERVLGKEFSTVKKDGFLRYVVSESEADDNCFQKIADVFLFGLKSIERGYPDGVRVEVINID